MENNDSFERAEMDYDKCVPGIMKPQAKDNFLKSLISEINQEYSYKNNFPRILSYDSMKDLQLTFPSLSSCNSSNFDPFDYINYDMIIIKAQYFDDLHKSMKYGIWSSTQGVNQYVNDLYLKNMALGKKTLLCFQITYEQHFVGLAQIERKFDCDIKFGFWQDKNQLHGNFKIKWLFVKNLSLDLFSENQNLIDEINFARHGEKLHQRQANSILRQFHLKKFLIDDSLFCFFSIFDQREDQMISSRTISDIKITLQKRQKKTIQGGKKKSELWPKKRMSRHNWSQKSLEIPYVKKNDDGSYIKKYCRSN